MSTLTYSQKINAWLQEKSGCGIEDYCRHFGYYSIAQKIIALDETNEVKSKRVIAKDKELKNLYITYANDDKAKRRKGENRSWTQYFKDLITGWVLEDLVMEMLINQGIEISHNGRDQKRVIALDGMVTQDADFKIKVGEEVRKVELTCEYNSILGEQGFIEKRAPSLYKLWKEKAIWIYRDLQRGKYVLVDFGVEPVKVHLRNHNTIKANWSKDVYRYVLEENNKHERVDTLLVPEIISVVGCSIEGKEQPKFEEEIDKDSPPKMYTTEGRIVTQSHKEEGTEEATKEEEVKEVSVSESTKESGHIEVVEEDQSDEGNAIEIEEEEMDGDVVETMDTEAFGEEEGYEEYGEIAEGMGEECFV